jgi:quinol monooxygenase YgiN
MVRLIVAMTVRPEKAPHLMAALRMLMGAVRLEPGFVECNAWTTDRNDATVEVHYEERWANEAAMEARVRSSQFTRLLEVVEQAPDSPQLEFEFVARRRGLEYVEAVRNTAR